MKILYLLNPLKTVENIYKHWDLLKQLAKQHIIGRYKGSFLGGGWAFVSPLFMLAVYTFVFSIIFKARWRVNAVNSNTAFALILFCGLIIFNIFAESINLSSTIINNNANYVKKVVFPLEILPVNIIISSLFFGSIWFIILFIGIILFMHRICITTIALPLILFPFILITIGICWFVASLGVYLRDISHLVGLVLQVLFFMTPIFYSIEMVPQRFRFILFFNPLTTIIQQTRNAVLFNIWPDWLHLGLIFVISIFVFQLGYVWFMKTKRGFADVL